MKYSEDKELVYILASLTRAVYHILYPETSTLVGWTELNQRLVRIKKNIKRERK